MLAAQMAVIHTATMTFARRLANVETIEQQDSAERALNKLARTFAMQMEALKRYRTGGGGTERLPYLVGRGRALEIVLGASDFDGDTAERYGYVNRALPDAELDGFTQAAAHCGRARRGDDAGHALRSSSKRAARALFIIDCTVFACAARTGPMMVSVTFRSLSRFGFQELNINALGLFGLQSRANRNLGRT